MTAVFAATSLFCVAAMGFYIVKLCRRMDAVVDMLDDCNINIAYQTKLSEEAFEKTDVIRRKMEETADRMEEEAEEIRGEREQSDKAQGAFEEGYSSIMNFNPDVALNAAKGGMR